MSRQSTAQSDINARTRMNQALALRKAGASLDDIARACGYASRSGAHKAIRRALSELPVQNATELRALELARLDELMMSHWKLAKSDVNRAHLILKIIDQRCKLLGIYVEPQKEPEPRTVVRVIPAGLLSELEQRLLDEQPAKRVSNG